MHEAEEDKGNPVQKDREIGRAVYEFILHF